MAEPELHGRAEEAIEAVLATKAAFADELRDEIPALERKG
jgi:hypothetical protein